MPFKISKIGGERKSFDDGGGGGGSHSGHVNYIIGGLHINLG